MKKLHILFFATLLLSSITSFSQDNFGINLNYTSQQELNQKCQRCLQNFAQKPKEVHFSIRRESTTNDLYFVIDDKVWFNQFFKNPQDGIAIDIISKERYNCSFDEDEIEETTIRGELLKPIYTRQLKTGLKPYEKRFRVKVGKVPNAYIGQDLEFNIFFLNDKNLCYKHTTYDLESFNWDLLDMGMYLDSLTYKTKLGTNTGEDGYTMKYKTLKFTIPFEKNKSEYSVEDIKPMYDSLRLTDYTIKKINIKAYSSVEGNLKRNIELQELRANSIVKALQSFQTDAIVTEVSSSENWVEFLNDIENTEYAYFSDLSKDEIKSKLVGATSVELEKYLKNHRKAVITLELEKKDKYKNKSPDELVILYNNAVSDGEIDAAIELQNSLFEKLNDKVIPPTFLNKMVTPSQIKYAKLQNKNSSMKYLADERNLLIVNNELKKLEKLTPRNVEVKYNLVVIKFKIWRHNVEPVDEAKFKKEILALQGMGISQKLIHRMLVNFHIIKSEQYMRKRDYANKDKSVAYINSNYKKIPLSDSDYLSLAQYFSQYSNTKMATELLTPKVKSIIVNEDLLFYYLNLTIIKDELTQTSDYRTIMLNAINMNQARYCRLFNPFGEGGVTFQLLEDEYLRKTYCENCTQ